MRERRLPLIPKSEFLNPSAKFPVPESVANKDNIKSKKMEDFFRTYLILTECQLLENFWTDPKTQCRLIKMLTMPTMLIPNSDFDSCNALSIFG